MLQSDNSENLAGLGVRYLHFFFFYIQGIYVYTICSWAQNLRGNTENEGFKEPIQY